MPVAVSVPVVVSRMLPIEEFTTVETVLVDVPDAEVVVPVVLTTGDVVILGAMSFPTTRAFNRPCVPLLTERMMPFAPVGDEFVMIALFVIVTAVVPESARAHTPTACLANWESVTWTTEFPATVGSAVVEGTLSWT